MSKASLTKALELIVAKKDGLGGCLCGMNEHCSRCDLDTDLSKAIEIGRAALELDRADKDWAIRRLHE